MRVVVLVPEDRLTGRRRSFLLIEDRQERVTDLPLGGVRGDGKIPRGLRKRSAPDPGQPSGQRPLPKFQPQTSPPLRDGIACAILAGIIRSRGFDQEIGERDIRDDDLRWRRVLADRLVNRRRAIRRPELQGHRTTEAHGDFDPIGGREHLGGRPPPGRRMRRVIQSPRGLRQNPREALRLLGWVWRDESIDLAGQQPAPRHAMGLGIGDRSPQPEPLFPEALREEAEIRLEAIVQRSREVRARSDVAHFHLRGAIDFDQYEVMIRIREQRGRRWIPPTPRTMESHPMPTIGTGVEASQTQGKIDEDGSVGQRVRRRLQRRGRQTLGRIGRKDRLGRQ